MVKEETARKNIAIQCHAWNIQCMYMICKINIEIDKSQYWIAKILDISRCESQNFNFVKTQYFQIHFGKCNAYKVAEIGIQS